MSLGLRGNRLIGGEQRQLGMPLALLIEGFDQMAPGDALAVVDLTQIEDLPLNHLAASTASALNDAPITVLLTVLEASVPSQIHRALIQRKSAIRQEAWSPLQRFCSEAPLFRLVFIALQQAKIAAGGHELGKWG
jgi:hypothetical protein